MWSGSLVFWGSFFFLAKVVFLLLVPLFCFTRVVRAPGCCVVFPTDREKSRTQVADILLTSPNTQVKPI